MSFPFTSIQHTVERDADLCCGVYNGQALSAQSFSVLEHYRARGWDIRDEKAAEQTILGFVRQATTLVVTRNRLIERDVTQGEQLVHDSDRLAACPVVGDERGTIQRLLATLADVHRAAQEENEALVTATMALPRLAAACQSPLMTKAVVQEHGKFAVAKEQHQALVAKLGMQCEQLRRSLARLDDPGVIAAARQMQHTIKLERALPPEAIDREIAKIETRMRDDDETLALLRACRNIWGEMGA